MARVLQAPKSWSIRNVHLYHDNESVLGGVYQNGSITGDNFYDMCTIFLDFQGSPSWSIFAVDDDGTTGALLPRDGNPLATGRYVVLSDSASTINVTFTSREAARRVYMREDRSSRISNMQKHFRNELRSRDHSCAMSEHKGGDPEDLFSGLEAAHIVPLARRNEWVNGGYANWITDNATPSRIGDNKMYSPHNGLLLNSILHSDFCKYKIAINPNDNYKIIAFKNVGNTISNVDGHRLQNRTTNPANGLGVSDNVLRWHFEQAVLAHMKGAAGEPTWEFDLGEDEIGEIMEGPYPGERMEVELYTRLWTRDGVSFSEG